MSEDIIASLGSAACIARHAFRGGLGHHAGLRRSVPLFDELNADERGTMGVGDHAPGFLFSLG